MKAVLPLLSTLRVMIVACMVYLSSGAYVFAQDKNDRKEALVILPIDLPKSDAQLEEYYGSAVKEALGKRYKVYYGEAVVKKLEKEYAKIGCTAERCMQNIALAFNGELVADTSITRLSRGYLIKLEIINVLTDEAVESYSITCKGCDEFDVIAKLKAIGKTAFSHKSPIIPQLDSVLNKVDLAAIKSIQDELVTINAGRFMMGSAKGQRDEQPVHRVEVETFRLMAAEVTWNQYQPCIKEGVCSENRKDGGDNGWGRGNRPVLEVSWRDIQKYIHWLKRKTGQRYRLPSEAEWEYAARAGQQGKYSWGNHIACNLARYEQYKSYDGQYKGRCGNPSQKTSVVKSYPANAFGLYDMHGNIWEWVQDCWHANYNDAPQTASVWSGGDCNSRVLRGGSWLVTADEIRSANRHFHSPSKRSGRFGFRLAQDI